MSSVRVTRTYRHKFGSLREAREHLNRRRVEDFEVVAGDEKFLFDGDLIQVGNIAYPISHGFMQAFCQYMRPRIPIRFAQEIPADLFATVANRLMRHHKVKGTRLKVRIERWSEKGEEWSWAFSLVTMAYQFIDHERVLEAALDTGVDKGTVVLTDRLMRVKVATIPFSVQSNGHTDDFKLGFELMNGENRFHQISAASFLFRVICKNGMVAPLPGGKRFKHRHVIDPGRALARVRKVLSAAPAWHEAADVYQQRIQRLTDMPAEGPWLRARQAEMSTVIGAKNARKVFEIYPPSRPGQPLSQFDVMNAMAQAARELENPDRRRTLETHAGNIVWRER
jgi:hypothetical protein